MRTELVLQSLETLSMMSGFNEADHKIIGKIADMANNAVKMLNACVLVAADMTALAYGVDRDKAVEAIKANDFSEKTFSIPRIVTVPRCRFEEEITKFANDNDYPLEEVGLIELGVSHKTPEGWVHQIRIFHREDTILCAGPIKPTT